MSGLLDTLANGARAILPEELERRSERLSDDMSKVAEGDINPLQMGVRAVGEAVGGFGDVAMNAIGGAASAVTPDFIEEPVSDLVKKGMQHIARGAMETGAAKVALKWADDNPEQARDLMMAFNMAELGMMGAGVAAESAALAGRAGLLTDYENQ